MKQDKNLVNTGRLKMSRLNVKDSEVFTVWTCKECPEAIFVHPDFFQDNGTPVCCDQDMIYDRTFVETETTAIFFKDDTNE